MSALMCLLLYGSRARGDFDVRSDVDLTAITAGDTSTPITIARATTTAYSLDDALRAARSGSLFAYHLVSEAIVLFESERVFARIQRAFRFRDDYTPVIEMCSAAGWFLIHHRDQATDPRKFNQAVAWCTREMLIARAATARTPVFSAHGLARFVDRSTVASVIHSKRSAIIDPTTLRRFGEILCEFGTREPKVPPSLSQALHQFRTAQNSAGVIAMRAFRVPPAGA
jgi:predicted nucleotidyltransferase